MTPQGGPGSAGPMSNYPGQSPMAGPGPGGRGFGGFGANMSPQNYGQMQGGGSMPNSAGGYGRSDQMQGNFGAPQSAGGFASSGQTNNFGGYQG